MSHAGFRITPKSNSSPGTWCRRSLNCNTGKDLAYIKRILQPLFQKHGLEHRLSPWYGILHPSSGELENGSSPNHLNNRPMSLLDAAGCCWMLLVAAWCCWMLLDVVGGRFARCCWGLLDANWIGCCWMLFHVAGCCYGCCWIAECCLMLMVLSCTAPIQI